MRITLLTILICMSHFTWGQIKAGFNPKEAKAFIAMCNSFTFLDLYKSDKEILPQGFKKTYTSRVVGMDNLFQVYENDSIGIINFRGSTASASSWMENMYSAMVPAKGKMNLDYKNYPYTFARNSSAAVHSGYALTVLLFSKLLKERINVLNEKGIHNIIFVGHSQGGALAHLTRAYFENMSKKEVSLKNVYKTYAFANPMCGNKAFAEEYNERFGEAETSFSIINPEDVVPKMPMHFDKGNKMSMDRLKGWVAGKETINFKKLGKDFFLSKIEYGLASYVGFSNRLIERLVSKTSVNIIMPPYTRDVNYFQVGKMKHLQPFSYPKILVDSALLDSVIITENDTIPAELEYKSEPSFFQHKPYNYYVGVLKAYFPEEYGKLEKRCLPENL